MREGLEIGEERAAPYLVTMLHLKHPRQRRRKPRTRAPLDEFAYPKLRAGGLVQCRQAEHQDLHLVSTLHLETHVVPIDSKLEARSVLMEE